MTLLARSLALGLALLAAAPAVPQTPRPAAAADWSKTVVATPLGLRIGNPAAPVQLIEYGSYTCPTCKRFKDEALATLMSRYVATGRVSFEFRVLPVHGAVDAAISQLVNCQAPAAAWATTTAAFAEQQTIIDAFVKIPQARAEAISKLPPQQALLQLATLGGLEPFAARRGLPKARFAQCIGSQPGLAKLQAASQSAGEFGIDSTPSFILNGRLQEGINDWGSLRQLIDAALE
ncbi:MAG: thioredoxin domain-containing protein [Alphaproteobacteria bacterium]|nr:thioredoxin domain-containing protein [Alphaproteobacteria bacterium]